ncbi:MAG: hypothetical protein ACXAEU_02140 [Candidatus Hodarchaeales archaeon]|jgi:hypothetical protein
MARISMVTTTLIVLFILLSLPFLLAFLPADLTEQTNFSIYNKGYGGASKFKEMFEEIASNSGKTANIKTLIGSANSLNRIAGSTGGEMGTLVILGPAVSYGIDESMAIMLYALKGGRVIVADDFGTGNDVLAMFNLLLSAMGDLGDGANAFGLPAGEGVTIPNPIVGLGFNKSLLVDTESYVKTSVQPLVTPPGMGQESEEMVFNVPAPWNEPLTQGITQGVVCNYATTLTMKVKYPDPHQSSNQNAESPDYYDPDFDSANSSTWKYITKWVPAGNFPATITELYGVELNQEYGFNLQIAMLYSSQKSWQESNVIAARNPETITPDSSEWGNVRFPVALHLPLGIPGEELAGSLTLLSDPSIFTNQMLDDDDPNYAETTVYDNKIFAENIINMMYESRGDNSDEEIVVYFDEGHLAHPIISPILYFGTFYRYLSMFSMIPIFAPFLPITVYGLVKKFRPKVTSGRALLMTKVEQAAGRSYFVVKMRFFIEYRQYTEGLRLIYVRTKRRINKRYQMAEQWSPEAAARYLTIEFKTAFNIKILTRELEEIEDIIINRVPLMEEQFLSYYLILKNINDRIGGD